MRSLEPSMTLTCTFTVSPGTKSSMFIGDTSLLLAAAGSDRGVTRGRADLFGRIWGVSQRAVVAHADNCSIVPDGLQSLKSSEIAAGRKPKTRKQPKYTFWTLFREAETT